MSWWPRGEDGEETVYQDTDSDVAEQRESGRVKVKWTQEEDENLKTLVQNFGQNDWKTIASFLPSRTEHQCQHRWFKVLNPDLIKGPWTKEEDEKVIDLVKKYGTKQWAMVAKHLKGRLGKQCRERWHNHLNPEVKKSSWTAEEDRIIYQAHRILGNRWAEIAKLLPGRTDNAVKNHWNSTIKRKVEMGFYAGDQDKAVTVVPQLEQGEVVAACPGKDKEVEFQCDVVMDVDPEPVSAEQDPAPVPKGPPSGEAPCSKSPPLPQLTGALTPKSEADAAGDPCPSRWVVDSAGFLSPTPLPAFKEALELIEGSSPRLKPACKKRSSGESCLPDSLKPFFKDLRYHEGGISTMTCKLCHFQVHSKPGTTSNFLRHIKDLEGWCDLATFDLSEDSQGSEVLQFRLEGSALQELSRGSRGELIPISPGGATPPSILTRRARRRPPAQSPGSSLIELNDSMTPKSTPVKILPFSPSQFLNMWTKQDTLDLENPSLTSTPVCSQKAIVSTPLHRDKTPLNQKDGSVFITPNHKADLSSTPRTPTPFRTALEKYGPLRPLPPTPSLEEDLKEVLRSEAGIELTAEDKTPQEQRRKQGHRPPMKKVRKSLALDVMDKESSTARPHPHRAHPRPSPEAENLQSVSLSSSSASVKKEDSVLDQGFIVAPGDVTPDPSPAPPTPMSQAWEAVVCGRTKDQLIMTEKARRYLRALNPNPPNRALILS